LYLFKLKIQNYLEKKELIISFKKAFKFTDESNVTSPALLVIVDKLDETSSTLEMFDTVILQMADIRTLLAQTRSSKATTLFPPFVTDSVFNIEAVIIENRVV
jgi:hypothetical protein